MASVESEMNLKSKKKLTGWANCSAAEKILFLVAICGFIVCITLLAVLGIMVGRHIGQPCKCNKTSSVTIKDELVSDDRTVKKSCHEFCSSKTCQDEVSFFMRNINKNVDPCDDFYQFACGNFMKNTPIPNAMDTISSFAITQENVDNELIDEIKGEVKPDELSSFKKLKTYYKNCMNTTRTEEEGAQTLLKTLDSLGGWPVLLGNEWNENDYVWTEALYKINKQGFGIKFPTLFLMSTDSKNSTNNIIRILNAFTKVSKTYLLDGRNSTIIQAYYTYMVDVAVMLGANKDVAEREMRDCLDFEINLYNAKSSSEQIFDTTKSYNPMTIKKLTEKHPSIPWLRILNEIFNTSDITIDENEIVILTDLKFIDEVEKLIARTSKKVIANYLIWQVLYDSIDYMPNVFRDRQLVFSKVERGVKERPSEELKCMNELLSCFPISLSALYASKHFIQEFRENVLDLVGNVKSQFRRKLEKVDWMDDETRKVALEKIDTMDVLVGYSDELLDDHKIDEYYKDLEINDGSYLKGAFNMSIFIRKQYLKDFRKPVNKKDWTTSVNAAITNAYYYLDKNLFDIPAGILRDSFYNDKRPNYLNYGAIGTIIGHEITHGFDNYGQKYDKNGNQIDWWDPATNEKFLQKAKCIIDQYSNYTVEEINMKLNGRLTQGENIADNGGFKTAYHAYIEWANRYNISEPCLKGLNYTGRQMFWISAANNWCRSYTVEELKRVVSQDTHSPSMARVDITFSNIREFAEDFGCEIGTKMNPVNKCVVW